MVAIEQPQVRLIADAQNAIGETPVWSVAEQALYWIDCEGSHSLFRWSGSGETSKWPMPERIGGVALRQQGGPIVVLHSGLFDLDLDSGTLHQRVGSPLPEYCSLHEGRCDPHGRFWVGAIDHRLGTDNLSPRGGTFFRFDGDLLTPVFDGISCSNGLAFSPDGSLLYHCDSPTGLVERWRVDSATGTLSGRSDFVRFPAGQQGGFDGATIDAEGGYWATAVFGSALLRFLPDGTLDRKVELPFSAPTCLAFGGPNMETLFITSARQELMGAIPSTLPNGAIYAFEPGVRGVEEPLLPF